MGIELLILGAVFAAAVAVYAFSRPSRRSADVPPPTPTLDGADTAPAAPPPNPNALAARPKARLIRNTSTTARPQVGPGAGTARAASKGPKQQAVRPGGRAVVTSVASGNGVCTLCGSRMNNGRCQFCGG